MEEEHTNDNKYSIETDKKDEKRKDKWPGKQSKQKGTEKRNRLKGDCLTDSRFGARRDTKWQRKVIQSVGTEPIWYWRMTMKHAGKSDMGLPCDLGIKDDDL